MIRIALCGAGGRIGRAMYLSLLNNKDFTIVFGVDPTLPADFPFPVFKSFQDVKGVDADIIFDYSSVKALDDILSYAIAHKTPAILATTGHSEEQMQQIAKAAEEVAIFKTSNMSLGVNLLSNLVKDATKFLGENYDVEIVETHHNKKLDAPSGTAIMLAQSVKEVRDNLFEVVGRHGNKKRESGEIGIHAVRGGTVIGKHTVSFFGMGESVSLSHEAESKDVFVMGSLKAAQFLVGKSSGLYNMNSLLGDFYAVTTVSGASGITLVSLVKTTQESFVGLLRDIASTNINLDMISELVNLDGTVSVSFTVGDNDGAKVRALLDNALIDYTAMNNTAKLTIEGAGMEHKSGVALEVMNVLNSIGAKIFAITTSETKISCCINSEKLKSAITALETRYGIK